MKRLTFIAAAMVIGFPAVTKATENTMGKPAASIAAAQTPKAQVAAIDSKSIAGSWKGAILPPGLTSFEIIRSAITFQPDGTFIVTTEKPTGTFTRNGSYSLQNDILTLTYVVESAAPEQYRFLRTAAGLTLEPLGKGKTSLTLLPVTISHPAAPSNTDKQKSMKNSPAH